MPLTFDELRARALGVVEAVEAETEGLGVVVILLDQVEGTRHRFAAETNRDRTTAVELCQLAAKGWDVS